MDAPQAALVAHCYPTQVHLGLDTMLSKPISFASSRALVCVCKLAGMSEIRIGWLCTAGALTIPTLLWVRIRASYVIFPSPAQTALNRRSAIRWLDAIAHAAVDVLTRLVH